MDGGATRVFIGAGAWLMGLAISMGTAQGQAARFPTIPPEHPHARKLLDNALRYVDPANKIVDPVSGYPVEGWNQDPAKGLFLRSFTQLTAIGQYMELLANVVAGRADTPTLSREEAARQLAKLVATLRADQADPSLAAKGLLGNFLDVATGKRLGPLASDVDKARVLEAFGPGRGQQLWLALQAAGWISPRNKDTEAEVRRGARYGYEYFDGPLAPFADPATRTKVMALLDRRVVMVIFGDNSNLSASVAKTAGALLTPEIKDRPDLAAIRRDLDSFLESQKDGYAHLYDARQGLFYFGWDATKDRLFGWEDPQGNWATGHMDYLVNEFRGPATFIAVRFGLPADAIANLGFKMKRYQPGAGDPVYVLAPWEGSAFQALGLSLSMGEPRRTGWRELLGNVVAVEVDFADRKDLPGFLSESYTGDGVQYTGSVGIPEITVSPRPRITDAASLYTLGVAYSAAPERVERFLAARWDTVSTLLTDHGPWEGYNVARREPIRFQTTAHTLALTLGLIGQGSADMERYLGSRGDLSKLAAFFRPASTAVDLLADDSRPFAWTTKGASIRSDREGPWFQVQGQDLKEFGLAFVPGKADGVDLSGTVMTLAYRTTTPIGPALLALKAKPGAPEPGLIPREIALNLEIGEDGDHVIRVPLPATPGLARIKEVVLTHGPDPAGRPVNLRITRLRFDPVAEVKP